VKEKIDAIVAAYERRLQQQAVGVVIGPLACLFDPPLCRWLGKISTLHEHVIQVAFMIGRVVDCRLERK
jgi:hypothetical protein